MRTASQILEEKGYDNAEQNDIVQVNSNSLDLQVREFFGVEEPIHLYESYYIGDADEDTMNELAIAKGYEGYEGLLMAMDEKLNEIAESFKSKFFHVKFKNFKINDFRIIADDFLDFVEELDKNSVKRFGFGQDHHSSERNPTYVVFKLSKEDAIEYNGDKYGAVSVDYNTSDIYLQSSYSEAKYNAKEYDGRGKGYKF